MKRIILKNASIYMNGTIIAGSLIIYRKKIHKIINEGHSLPKRNFFLSKTKTIEIDCEKRLILPGLIDVHAHLRDMGQSEKETFFTATKAAAFNGITTVFNMPNTSPPAITYKQIESWLKKAKKNIFIDVGFIAGVPPHFDEQEVKRIIKKRIFGFKIYPHNSINGIDWTDTKNLQHILKISSKFNIPIFFHSEWPNLSNNYDTSNNSTSKKEVEDLLNLHDKLKPLEAEYKYLKFVIENYFQYIKQNPTHPYPFIHLCHISSKLSYDFIQQIQALNKNYKISMEVTPHHLLLNKSIQLLNPKIAKVDPPLRDSKEQQYLYDQFVKGDIKIIASDHAPHTIAEKSKGYFDAPSGFPEFDTYPLILLDNVFDGKIPLSHFVKACSENPAITFNLKKRGFIREKYYANLMIIEETEPYSINPDIFKSKAKFSPYKGFKTKIKIWKVFYKGREINKESILPNGRIISA